MVAPRPVLIASTAELKQAAEKLAGAAFYYLDTEFETAGPAKKLCLVQVSRGAGETYLIDTVALSALEPLAKAISGPEAEWVVHAGNQDVALLKEALHLGAIPGVFDTQVAWGLLGAEYPVSLAYLLYRILGIRSSKSEQAGPWMARPLTREQLEYAAGDVDHLPAIRDWLRERLEKLGRLELAKEASGESVLPDPPGPLGMEEFRNAWQLDPAGQAALRFLIDWWNALPPGERGEAPQPRTFLTVAKLLPESGQELAKIRGLFYPWVKRHGDAFTGKLLRASAEGARGGYVPLEPPPYNTFDRIRAEGWIRKALSDVCAELQVAPEIAFPERLVRRMIESVDARQAPAAAAEVLGGWRGRLLRSAFLARLPS
ncbi:MAG TPA: hypothetical protein VEN81_03980 [Planctomycetota bacterium]|nr:hypothetical protein [Planctomycetota bacterium]